MRGTPGQVTVADPNFGSMQKYQDAAYDHAMRSLQPSMDQQNRKFHQQLVNQGIDPNSAAGRNAADQLARNQNDARQSALFQAMQFGQGAQQQAFGQGLGVANLAQQQDQFGRNLSQNDRHFQQNLGWQKDSFAQNRQDANTDRAMNMLSQALGMDYNIWQGNNAAADQRFNARQAVAGSIPGWNPAMIDVNGSANAATNSQQAAFDAQMATNPMNTLSQAGVAAAGAWSDVRLKDNLVKIGEVKGHNVYEWEWNEAAAELGLEGSEVGFIAQELPGEFVTIADNGYLAVNYAAVVA
jgi:hypothetical protein